MGGAEKDDRDARTAREEGALAGHIKTDAHAMYDTWVVQDGGEKELRRRVSVARPAQAPKLARLQAELAAARQEARYQSHQRYALHRHHAAHLSHPPATHLSRPSAAHFPQPSGPGHVDAVDPVDATIDRISALLRASSDALGKREYRRVMEGVLADLGGHYHRPVFLTEEGPVGDIAGRPRGGWVGAKGDGSKPWFYQKGFPVQGGLSEKQWLREHRGQLDQG